VEPSDEALCARVAERDDRAFDLLVSRYQARAYRIAWSIVRDADEARDLSQEAFLRLYERAGRFEGRARFSTWFYRLLVNVCLDHRRRHQWWRRVLGSGRADEPDTRPALEEHPASDPPPDEDAARKETMTRVWAEVERLSPQQRAVVRLQLDGLRTAEIAEVLDCSEATARVHLHRAMTALRKTVGSRA
jgi:RNA polymerase sigma-70 factor (ECF subfamily)